MENFEPFATDGVRGFLHRASGKTERGLVLTHGAGGNCTMPLLVAAATAFAEAGFDALRCDLPFRQRRPSGPPSPSGAAADREGLRLAVAAMRALGPRQVVLGGQSYGGRQTTMLAADAPGLASALLLFSYPLHPPGKPERLRMEHFPRLRVPCIFVQGANDPFGTPIEMAGAIRSIPALTELIPVDGAGHDLKRGRIDLASVVAAVGRKTASASV